MPKSWPKPYSCKFLEAGIVSYEDSDAGIALVKKETIDAMSTSFVGKPVCINHQKITPDNYEELRKKGLIVGNVFKVWFNPSDGWFYADFIVDTDEAIDKIDNKGWSVSCAYDVIDVKEGGLWHDIKYDGEIIEGSFTHLALVEMPRYEESEITKLLPAMLVNGKAAHTVHNQEGNAMNIFKFMSKNNSKEEDFSKVHIAFDGKALPLNKLLMACMINSKPLEAEAFVAVNDKQMYMAKDEDIVDINGQTVSIGDLKAAYHMKTENEKKNCSCGVEAGGEHKGDCKMNKKNEKEEEEKKKAEEAKNAKEEEEKKAEEAKNAKEEEEKKAKEAENKKNEKELEEKKEKENAKLRIDSFFQELSNAGKQFEEEAPAKSYGKTREERAADFHKSSHK